MTSATLPTLDEQLANLAQDDGGRRASASTGVSSVRAMARSPSSATSTRRRARADRGAVRRLEIAGALHAHSRSVSADDDGRAALRDARQGERDDLRRAPHTVRDLDPDYAALPVADQILGGSPDSRLALRLREKDGLSYAVGSFMQPGQIDDNGTLGMYAIFPPKELARVRAAFDEELARVLKDGFTADEVAGARRALLEERRTNRAQDSVVAGALVRSRSSAARSPNRRAPTRRSKRSTSTRRMPRCANMSCRATSPGRSRGILGGSNAPHPSPPAFQARRAPRISRCPCGGERESAFSHRPR